MRNAIISLSLGAFALLAAASLGACADQAAAPATASAPAATTLSKVQSAASVVYADLKADVLVYESAHPELDAAAKSDLDQSITDLGVAVANLSALQEGDSYQTYANAFLNVAQSVVDNLPTGVVSAATKQDVDLGIALAKSLVTLAKSSAPRAYHIDHPILASEDW